MVAPPLGGLMLWLWGDEWGWRINFLLDVPVALLLLGVGLRCLPANSVRAPRWSLDPVGLGLLGRVRGRPHAALPRGPRRTPVERGRPGPPVLGLACGRAFLAWEQRYEDGGGFAVVSPRLWRVPSFRSGVLVGALFFLATAGSTLVAGLYLQRDLGLPAVEVALLSVSASLASAATAWWGGSWSVARGRLVVAVGIGGVAVGVAATTAVCLAASAHPAAVWLMIPAQVVFGGGAGLVTAPNQSLSMTDVPRVDGSVAGSVFQVGQRMGTAIGTTLALHLFYAFADLSRGLLAASALVVVFLLAALAACGAERRGHVASRAVLTPSGSRR